jgi:Tol biopolymer transport system component
MITTRRTVLRVTAAPFSMTRRDVFRFSMAIPLALAVSLGVPAHAAVHGARAVRSGNATSTGAHVRRVFNGKIAFVGIINAPSISVINPNGSALRRLTPHCLVRLCIIREVAWSPDGRRLAFVRGHSGGAITAPRMSLFVMDAGGTHTKRLATCGGACGADYGSRLSWSPDGSRIAFSRFDSAPQVSGVFVAQANGAGVRRLTRGTDVSPAWSPDGSRIVFVRNTRHGSVLKIVRTDGSGVRSLTSPPVTAGNPVWSPNGRIIAFDGTRGIYSVKADGSHLRLLASGISARTGPGVPAWSPDGRRILFFSTVGNSDGYEYKVGVMNADGSQQNSLYHSVCCLAGWDRPIWSPDGKRIAFGVVLETKSRPGVFLANETQSGIFVIHADGSKLRRVLRSSRAGTQLAWQPIGG